MHGGPNRVGRSVNRCPSPLFTDRLDDVLDLLTVHRANTARRGKSGDALRVLRYLPPRRRAARAIRVFPPWVKGVSQRGQGQSKGSGADSAFWLLTPFLEAPRVDALVDCSDRRVCGCLDLPDREVCRWSSDAVLASLADADCRNVSRTRRSLDLRTRLFLRIFLRERLQPRI
jgi:hypothetical protein